MVQKVFLFSLIFWANFLVSNTIEAGDYTIKWKAGMGFPFPSSSCAIAKDGTIYPGGSSGKLYAINPDGTTKWFFDCGDHSREFFAPAIGAKGTIYTAGFEKFYAINPDGTLNWVFETGSVWEDFTSTPAIGSDGTIYAVVNRQELYAINPNGTLKWKVEYTGSNYNFAGEVSPAVGSDGTIYVGSNREYFYAFNPNGTQRWVLQTGGSVNASPAIGSDGTIYVGAREPNEIYAINPNGNLKWVFPVSGWVISSPAIGIDGTIYVAANDLFAINPDGTLKWCFETDTRLNSSPAIDSNGTIYVGNSNFYSGKIYAISPTGKLNWFVEDFGPSYAPTIDSYGTIYVSSLNEIYAIRCSSKGPANSPWPMFHHDSRHTANVESERYNPPQLTPKRNVLSAIHLLLK